MSNNALTLFSADSVEAQLAKAGILIKSGLVPKTYDKPEAVLVACTFGAELGFTPMQSLAVINIIEGKPTLGINALLALCQKEGGEVNVIENTDAVCKLEISRPGRSKPHVEIYTMGDAQKAGLAGKHNWVKQPKAMLFARAASAGIRRVFADKISGFYSTEEMQDSIEEKPTPVSKSKKVEAPAPAPVQDAAVMDVPIIEEPALPEPQSDIYSELYNGVSTAHNAVLEQAYKKHFPKVEYTSQVFHKLNTWATKKGLKVGEIDLEISRMKKD